jgi:hypothetical protein
VVLGTVSTHTNSNATWLCAVQAAIELVHGHNYQQDLVILLKHCVVISAVVLSRSCIGASISLVPGGGQVHALLYPLSA